MLILKRATGISYTITSCHLAPQEYRESNPKEGEIMAHFDVLGKVDSYDLMMDVLEKTNVLIIVGDAENKSDEIKTFDGLLNGNN